METTLEFFANLSSIQKLIWIIICLGIFWILEGIYPLFNHDYKKTKHAKVNLVLLGTTILINVLFGIITAGIFLWISKSNFGLLNMIEMPLWLKVVFGVLLLDLIAQYAVHFLLHKVNFMWRFHMVHHSDTKVDVTTGTRHHPGDYIFREIFALLAVLIGGMSFGIYMIYRILTVICTYWAHANINLPKAVDKFLSFVIVTPNMHKFHHHFERPWTDTNFGNIFSIWDRIFGTFVYEDTSKIKYGLDVLEDDKSEDLAYQLKVPFNKNIKTDY